MTKWVNGGETNVLNIYLKNSTQNTALYLGLYKNTSEPAISAVLSDLTEPTDTGYARIEMAAANWTLSGSNPVVATQTQKTFTFNADGGSENVYGYFITTVATGTVGTLVAVETFSNAPYEIRANGDRILITPTISC